MLDNTRLTGELAHIHRTLSNVAASPSGKMLAEDLRRATGATTAAVIWQSLFADCLRVVHSAVAADGEIVESEVEAIYDLLFSIARHYAGVQPSSYGAFEAIEHEQTHKFLAHYAADRGPFGQRAERHWPGLLLCRKAAELGEQESLERYERMMSWLISESCRIGGVTETDPRWRGRVDELHELRRVLAHTAKVNTPKVDLRVPAFLARTRVFAAVQQPSSIYDDDPFDVETIHAATRETFAAMVDRANSNKAAERGRMLLILGDSGTGKTHLLRGLRKHVHEFSRGFVVYAQLHSTSDDYARYLLQHVVDSLARPYAGPSGERSGLIELASGLPSLVGEPLKSQIERLTFDNWATPESLSQYVHELGDELLLSGQFAGFDPDLLRVLLFALHPDPRTTARVYKYLRCENMNTADGRWIGGAVPRLGKDDPRWMIRDLGKLAALTRRGALVLMVDQAELSGFDASSVAAFRRAVDTLHTVVSDLPSAIAVIACLTDLYDGVRNELSKFAIDRLERDPEIERLQINRSYEEIVAIVGKRLSWMYAEAGAVYRPETPVFPIPESSLRALTNHRTRSILEWCHQFQSQCATAGKIIEGDDEYPVFIETQPVDEDLDQIAAAWNDAMHAPDIELPDEDDEIIALLGKAAELCAEESGLALSSTKRKNGALRLQLEAPAERTSERASLAVAITNRSYQAGAFASQIESLRRSAKEAVPVAIRTAAYPRGPGSESVVAQLLKNGGRAELLDASTLRTLVAYQQFQPDFLEERVAKWRQRDRPLSSLPVIARIFDLERLSCAPPLKAVPEEVSAVASGAVSVAKPTPPSEAATARPTNASTAAPPVEGKKRRGRPPGKGRASTVPPADAADVAGAVPVAGTTAPAGPAAPPALSTALRVGTATGFSDEARTIEVASLLRHTGILGSPGSGKTTLALNLIEQALERNVAVVLVDRKGDLAGYAKDDWWQHTADPERAKQLADRMDVRLFTPGTHGGRPLSISVVPELEHVPAHERDRMIGYAAQALAAMMRLGAGANDTARRAILVQAIAVLTERKSKGGLLELITLLENRDDALIARAGRYDDKLFMRLLQDLETVRLSEAELFDSAAEPLSAETLIGRKANGKVPLAIVSTKFLGEVERVQSWVAHLIACLSRHISRAPSTSLHTLFMIDEADLFMPAGASKPPSKEPLQDMLKRARAGGLGVVLASQSPADFDYRSREQINTWFLGRIAERRSIDKMKPLFEQRPAVGGKLGNLEEGRFVMLQEGGASDLDRTPSMLRTVQIDEAQLMALAAASKPAVVTPSAAPPPAHGRGGPKRPKRG